MSKDYGDGYSAGLEAGAEERDAIWRHADGLAIERDRLLSRVAELETILDECLVWLCPHTEAAELKRKHPDVRAWCCDCHNYLRAPEDATLMDRARELLERKT